MTSIRGFKPVFTAIGVLYVLLASSFLVRGVSVLRDFAVPETAIATPVLQDFFFFFYQLMLFVGVLTALFGLVVRELKAQLLVTSVFCITNILLALRDLSTSDCSLGNHLYKGDKTLVFVFISLSLAAAFGLLTVRGLRAVRGERRPS